MSKALRQLGCSRTIQSRGNTSTLDVLVLSALHLALVALPRRTRCSRNSLPKSNGTYLAKIRPVTLRLRAEKLKAPSAIVGRREGRGQGSPAPGGRFDHGGRRYAFPPCAMAGPLSECHSPKVRRVGFLNLLTIPRLCRASQVTPFLSTHWRHSVPPRGKIS